MAEDIFSPRKTVEIAVAVDVCQFKKRGHVSGGFDSCHCSSGESDGLKDG